MKIVELMSNFKTAPAEVKPSVPTPFHNPSLCAVSAVCAQGAGPGGQAVYRSCQLRKNSCRKQHLNWPGSKGQYCLTGKVSFAYLASFLILQDPSRSAPPGSLPY